MSDQLFQIILEKLDIMDKRISNIEITMATKSELEDIKSNMTTKKDIEELPWLKKAIYEIDRRTIEIQENQEKLTGLLETISLRLIEHETEIRKIKLIR